MHVPEVTLATVIERGCLLLLRQTTSPAEIESAIKSPYFEVKHAKTVSSSRTRFGSQRCIKPRRNGKADPDGQLRRSGFGGRCASVPERFGSPSRRGGP